MARGRRVQISIDEEHLSRIDEDPEARDRGRSAFIRSAVRHYLEAKKQAAIDGALRTAYEGRGKVALDEIEPLIDGRAWPPP